MVKRPSTTVSKRRDKRAARRPRPGDRAGAATVEFSLCAFIVFTLFLGMVEVARFHIVRHSIDQAVYVGARTAIVPGATAGEAEQAALDRLQAAGVIGPSVTITPNVITSETQAVTVRITAPYESNSWTLPRYFSGVDVAAEMTLDHENVAYN